MVTDKPNYNLSVESGERLPPSVWRRRLRFSLPPVSVSEDSEAAETLLEGAAWNGLRQNVGIHRPRGTVLQADRPSVQLVPNEVMLDIDVLLATVMDGVPDHRNRRLVVLVNQDEPVGDADLAVQLLQVERFPGGRSQRHVLRAARRSAHRLLLPGIPGNGARRSELEDVSGGGLSCRRRLRRNRRPRSRLAGLSPVGKRLPGPESP